MPEIDSDLFQVLALLLLFLTLITLLAALSALSKIRKALEGRPQVSVAPEAQTYEAPPAQTYEAPAPAAAAHAAPTQVSQPAPQAAQPEVATGFVPVSEAVPAATSTALRGDEPDEQPFERDGRWWFKRGGELLVYDEGTGQWVAAPQAGAVTPAAATATSTLPATGAVPADAGEGWKCSSCGAINGSTATSCRMCFAPR